jgi:hypothetical protein
MHEKIEMKTNTRAVAVTAGWPMALALLVMGGMVLLLFPLREGWPMLLLLATVMGLTFLWCLKLYLGTYIFLPPTEIKGARIIARLGRHNEVEISGVLAEEVIVRQGWIEKLCGVCHIRQKGTVIYLRGVNEPERVKAWVAANFPRERKAAPVKGKKGKK